MTEQWKDITGFEGIYQISSTGRIKSLKRVVPTWNGTKTIPERILKLQIQKNGYIKHKFLGLIHRLVAKAFIPTDNYELVVNHINGVKHDNRVENLEWCTVQENNLHAIKTGLVNKTTRQKMSEKAKLRTGYKNSCWRGYVAIYDKQGNLIKKTLTLKDAAIYLKTLGYEKASKSNICNCIHKKIKTCYGFTFKYIKE